MADSMAIGMEVVQQETILIGVGSCLDAMTNNGGEDVHHCENSRVVVVPDLSKTVVSLGLTVANKNSEITPDSLSETLQGVDHTRAISATTHSGSVPLRFHVDDNQLTLILVQDH